MTTSEHDDPLHDEPGSEEIPQIYTIGYEDTLAAVLEITPEASKNVEVPGARHPWTSADAAS